MLAYVIRRVVFGAAVLIGTSLITFAIAFVIPADPAVAVAGAKADPATLAAIRRELGLDRPLYFQYARYVDRALHGDLGRSYIRREEVAGLILSRFPATAILALAAMALSLALGIPMGMLAAAWRERARPGLDSGLLARHYPVDRRRPLPPMVSAGRFRRLEESGLADPHARARQRRLLLAHPPDQPRRRDGSGIRAHRARQGFVAARRDV